MRTALQRGRRHVWSKLAQTRAERDSTMNRSFSPSLVQPSRPLRKPTTEPGLISQTNMSTVFDGRVSSLLQGHSPTSSILESFKAEANKKENDVTPATDSFANTRPILPPVVLKLCNYCSQQGNLRCTRCKKTCYCSLICQAEDWKAHRHVCKESVPEKTVSDKPKEPQTLPSVSEHNVLELKVNNIEMVQPKRIFCHDLQKNSISQGDEVQGYVVELKNPGTFFIQVHTMEMAERLRTISLDLQKTYSSSNGTDYIPEIGEACAVKFSRDRHWYRGEVKSVDLAHQTAKVLHIDFGSEEDVRFDSICPLAVNINCAPCALHCCVAGIAPMSGGWSGECAVAVRQLIVGKSLIFTVVDILNDGSLLAVDALLPMLDRKLSRFLIDQGYATKLQTKQDIYSLLTASFENFKRSSGEKDENIEAQPPEPLTQRVGDTFTAVVTHLQSPTDIICQKLENASVIQQLQTCLREHCFKTPYNEKFRPAPGTVCCSLFSEDNQWYRAKVLAYSSEDHVCVGYIDFGNSEEVNLNNLRPISMDLLSLPSQAFPCSLAGIKPNLDTWSEEEVMTLKLLVSNRFLRVEILGERDGKALVSIVDESTDPQVNVAELMLAAGYAAAGNAETNIDEAAQEIVSDSPVGKLEWSCAELPVDGQQVVLVVRVLENPGEFYCYNQNGEDMLQTLAELSSALLKHCETNRIPFNPVVGGPCCALFNEDGLWYRAMVQSVEEDGKVRVCFVDYGSSCVVETDHLRAIRPSLLKLPFQAIRCWLAGVEPVGTQWSKNAVQRFHTLSMGKPLSGKVLAITEKGYGVELRCNGQNIADILLSEQLARAVGQESKPATQAVNPSNLPDVSPAQILQSPTEKPPLDEQSHNATGQNEAALLSHPSEDKNTVRMKQEILGMHKRIDPFTLDWKTLELPRNENFQLQVAAAISPSLFYVMNPRKVDVKELQAVMADVARYCSTHTESNRSIPQAGAACCAQFSDDNNWYRAVVLDTTNTHASVIYADYGNMERVPLSRILPIPKELVQLPFQIARCALSGREHFPAEWPPEVLELFGIQLSGTLLASVQDFDGTFNLLVLAAGSSDQVGSDINSIILGALRKDPVNTEAQARLSPVLVQEEERVGSAVEVTGQTQSADVEKTEAGNQVTAYISSCCCADLKLKMDRIEELLLMLLKQMKP